MVAGSIPVEPVTFLCTISKLVSGYVGGLMTRVVAFGTFDLLHFGHVTMLEKAKALGGEGAELIVVISRDASSEKVKGHPPIFPEDQRLNLIKSLKVVNEAILGYKGDNWKDRLNIIMDLKPDIIVLGYDQPVDINALNDELQKRGLEIQQIKRLEKYGDSSFNSSSKIIKKIIEKSALNNAK